MIIRKLEWRDLYLDRGDGSKDPAGWEAETGFGIYYTIEMYFGSDSYGWEVMLDYDKISDHDDPEQAKQSAQNDFVRRILLSIIDEATTCHCGKDGHALNSVNCPVHGYTITPAHHPMTKDTDQ